MRAVILQSNYIPWKGYFHLIRQADLFVFYDEVQYTKNDWRNRNRIYTRNGLQWLTIPVAKEAVKQKVSEVQLSAEWQSLHYKSLLLGYKSAPYFYQLEALMQDYLLKQQWTSLSELNQYLIKKISKQLGIQTRFLNSADYHLEGDKVNRLINLLKQIGATHYLSGPGGRNYLAEAEQLFANSGINLEFMIYPEYKPYPQLSIPFEQAVSILDMIAHLPYSEISEYIWN